MGRKFFGRKQRGVSFFGFCLVASLAIHSFALTPIVQEAQQSPDDSENTKPSSTDWSKNVDGIAIRISPTSKRKWGRAEIPTFRLEAKTFGTNQKTVLLNNSTAKLILDGNEFRIPPSVSVECQLTKNANVETLFRLRLSQADWDKADSENESKNYLASLPELGIGKHKIRFQFSSDAKKLLTIGDFEFEVTKNDFESSKNTYVLKDFYGNPLKDAKVYAIGNGRMTIRYTQLTNSGFASKYGEQYETEVEQGQKYEQVEPMITDDNGLFSINALPNDTRIVVVPKVGSVQEFSLSDLKGSEVKLAQTGNLIIKRDVEGDESFYRVDVYRVPSKIENQKQELGAKYISEYMQLNQKNGESYLLQKLRPGKYKIRMTKSIRKETQIEYLSSNEQTVEIKADETTRLVTEYKKGQKVKVKVTGIKSNIDFVKVKLVRPGEVPSSSRSISFWADGRFDVKSSAEFLSHKIPPGNYTLFVSATPRKDPGADRFAPSPRVTHMASKTVVVQADGVVDAGTIKLIPKDLWLEQSPNTLRMKFVDNKGALVKDAIVFQLYKGLPTYGVRMFRETKGVAVSQVKFGDYRFVLASPTKATTVFKVTVPNMAAHKIVVNEIPAWYNKAKAKAALKIKVATENIKTSPVFKVLIENTADEEIAIPNSTFRFTSSLIKSGQMRMGLSCYFPDRLNNEKVIFKAKSKTELEFKWNDMIKNGYWRGLDFRRSNFPEIKSPPGLSAAKFEIGSASSNIFYAPTTN